MVIYYRKNFCTNRKMLDGTGIKLVDFITQTSYIVELVDFISRHRIMEVLYYCKKPHYGNSILFGTGTSTTIRNRDLR